MNRTMPKTACRTDRYRLYHVEKARGGIALTMTAGSAVVSRDSPPAFGNLLAYKDEIVPWLRKLADECHGHGAAVMIQLTHLGRRTNWNKGDWLPVLSASPAREPAHRAFPKEMEDWDFDRIAADYAGSRRAHEGSRPRWVRVRVLRPSDGQLLVTRHQSTDRRAQRQHRQPPALHLPHPRSCPQDGRSRLPGGMPAGRRRGLGPRPQQGRWHRPSATS